MKKPKSKPKVVYSRKTGLTPENIPHIMQVMRTGNIDAVRSMAKAFSEHARKELADIPAYRPDEVEAKVYKEKGLKCPGWNLEIVEAPEGVSGLIMVLAEASLSDKNQSKLPKWLAGAKLLRYSLDIEYNPSKVTERKLNMLEKSWASYNVYLGVKERQKQSDNANRKIDQKDIKSWKAIHNSVEKLKEDRDFLESRACKIIGKKPPDGVEIIILGGSIRRARSRNVTNAINLMDEGMDITEACSRIARGNGEDVIKLRGRVEKVIEKKLRRNSK